MDSRQPKHDAYEAQAQEAEATEWNRKLAARQRYEYAAKDAHTIRLMNGLLLTRPVVPWEDMALASQRHLIADAEAVAANPSITSPELEALYKARLTAWGDTESSDLQPWDESTCQVEEMVLVRLKQLLAEA